MILWIVRFVVCLVITCFGRGINIFGLVFFVSFDSESVDLRLAEVD